MKDLNSSQALHTFIFVLLILRSVTCRNLRYTFNIKIMSGSPDGVHKNNILSINGLFPGPTIQAEVGDTVEVDVINNIQDGQNTTIHWHGIHMRGTPFEDGPSLITQCPIGSGQRQRYSFAVDLPGTYWYHSHVNSQYTEGLWGVLIVRNTPEVYQSEYEDEIIITLNDWYHQSAHDNEKWFMRPESRGAPPYMNSVLLNGCGRYPCEYASRQGLYCSSAGQKRPVFKIIPGKAYRLRLINTSAWAAFNFTIDGHRLEAIEADGIDSAWPVPADAVFIGAGQRYSFLLKTPELGPLSLRYLMRANLRKDFLFTYPNENINPYPEVVFGEVTAVLEYDLRARVPVQHNVYESFDHTQRIPAPTRTNYEFLNENYITPYDRVYAPEPVDQEFVVGITFSSDYDGIRRAAFNNTPFILPQGKPLLFKMLNNEELPPETFPLVIGYMNVIQVVVNNPFNGPHPLHLHGHHFWVLGQGKAGEGSYNSRVHFLNALGVKRDTIMVKEQSWLVLRFIADNPGVWTFHCHIDWHNLSGMAMTFVEAPEIARTSFSIPLSAREVCEHQGIFI